MVSDDDRYRCGERSSGSTRTTIAGETRLIYYHNSTIAVHIVVHKGTGRGKEPSSTDLADEWYYGPNPTRIGTPVENNRASTTELDR